MSVSTRLENAEQELLDALSEDIDVQIKKIVHRDQSTKDKALEDLLGDFMIGLSEESGYADYSTADLISICKFLSEFALYVELSAEPDLDPKVPSPEGEND